MTTLRKLTTVMELDITDVVNGVEQVKKITQQVTTTTSQSVDAISQSYSKFGRVVKISEDKVMSAKAAVTQHQRALNKAEVELNKYAASVQHAASLVGKTALEQEILNKQFLLGAGATEQQKKAIAELVKQEYALNHSVKSNMSAFRAQRNSFSQIGYQIQDVAVQAQMGTDAFVILGQQGSQVASLFGAGGAVFGAVIAIGAALSGVLIKAITGAGNTVKDFKADVNELAKSLDDLNKLTPSQLDATLVAVIKRENELNKEFKVQSEVVDKLNTRLAEQQKTLNSGAYANNTKFINKLNESIKNTRLELIQEQSNLDEINSALIDQRVLYKDLQATKKGEQTSSQRTEVSEILASLRLQVDNYGDIEKATILANAAKAKASELDMVLIENAYEQLKVLKEKEQIEKKEKAELESKLKTSEAYISSLSEEVKLIGLSEDEKIDYVAATKGVTDQQRIEITNLLTLKKLKLDDMKADKDRAKLLSTLTDEGRLAELESQYKTERALLSGHHKALEKLDEKYNRDRLKISGTFWQKYAIAAQDSLMSFDEQVASSLDNFTRSFGTAFADAVFESKSLGGAVEDMFKSMGKSMIAYFAEWAAQKVMLWVLDQTIGTAQQTSAAVTTTSNATAAMNLAAIQAYQSAAAIPYVGWMMAPAAMASAFAVTAPLVAAASSAAFAGVMDKGGTIPSGAGAIVSEIGDELVGGTMVYNGSPNSLKVTGREETARKMGGGNNVNIVVNSNGDASPEAITRALVRALKKGNKRLDNEVYGSMNRGRVNGGKRFA